VSDSVERDLELAGPLRCGATYTERDLDAKRCIAYCVSPDACPHNADGTYDCQRPSFHITDPRIRSAVAKSLGIPEPSDGVP